MGPEDNYISLKLKKYSLNSSFKPSKQLKDKEENEIKLKNDSKSKLSDPGQTALF